MTGSRLLGEVACEEVISDTDTGHPDPRPSTLDLHEPRDPGLTHQPAHPPARNPDVLTETKLGLDPPGAVDTAGPLVDLGDPRGQPRITERPGCWELVAPSRGNQTD